MVRLVPVAAATLTGIVTSLQSAGIRQRACVRVGTTSVFVELAPQLTVAVGAQVGLELPTEALHAVRAGP